MSVMGELSKINQMRRIEDDMIIFDGVAKDFNSIPFAFKDMWYRKILPEITWSKSLKILFLDLHESLKYEYKISFPTFVEILPRMKEKIRKQKEEHKKERQKEVQKALLFKEKIKRAEKRKKQEDARTQTAEAKERKEKKLRLEENERKKKLLKEDKMYKLSLKQTPIKYLNTFSFSDVRKIDTVFPDLGEIIYTDADLEIIKERIIFLQSLDPTEKNKQKIRSLIKKYMDGSYYEARALNRKTPDLIGGYEC